MAEQFLMGGQAPIALNNIDIKAINTGAITPFCERETHLLTYFKDCEEHSCDSQKAIRVEKPQRNIIRCQFLHFR
jgi:hypothetical protein